jgi:hypothetical protein
MIKFKIMGVGLITLGIYKTHTNTIKRIFFNEHEEE